MEIRAAVGGERILERENIPISSRRNINEPAAGRRIVEEDTRNIGTGDRRLCDGEACRYRVSRDVEHRVCKRIECDCSAGMKISNAPRFHRHVGRAIETYPRRRTTAVA